MKRPLSHRKAIPFFCHKSEAAFRADIVVSFDGGGGGGGGEGEGRRLRQDDGDDGEGGGGALLQTKLQLVTASYCQLHF